METERNRKHTYSSIIFIFIVLILLFFTIYDYTTIKRNHIENELKRYTQENNSATSKNISDALIQTTAQLQSYADMLQAMTLQDALKLLKKMDMNNSFLHYAIIDMNGNSHSTNGVIEDVSSETYFINGMQRKAKNIYHKNNKTMLFTAPIINSDHKITQLLKAELALEDMNSYLSLTSLSRNTNFYIINENHELITSRSNEQYIDQYIVSFQGKQVLQHATQTKSESSFTLTLSNKKRYTYFTHIKNSDWYVISVLPANYANEQMKQVFQQITIFALKLGAIAVLITGYLIYQQKRKSNRIKDLNKQLDDIIANNPGVIFKYPLHQLTAAKFFNNEIEHLTGYTAKALIEKGISDIHSIITKEDYSSLVQDLYSDTSLDTFRSFTYRIIHKKGHKIWIYDRRHIVKEDGILYFYVTWINITEMKNTQEQLKISEERYRMILEESGSIMFEWDIHSDIIRFSDHWQQNYGYPNYFNDFLKKTEAYTKNRQNTYLPLLEIMIKGKERDMIECEIQKADGTMVWCRIVARSILDHDDYILCIIGSISDISEQKEKTLRLEERSRKDGLTKLLNRQTIEEAVNSALKQDAENIHYLFVIDIDDFKRINDTFGHSTGDEALQKIAQSIQQCFRVNDYIGRIGGDEFVVFLRNMKIKDGSFIQHKANRLLQSLTQIKLKNQSTHKITCSIGIARYPDAGSDFHELFQIADIALYEAKAAGKNQYAIK